MSERIAIVAALEREVAPLLRRWGREAPAAEKPSHLPAPLAPGVSVFRFADTILLCAGIGPAAAARAARAAIELHRPALLVSAGFAGSLDPRIRVADIVCPANIIDADSGRIFTSHNENNTTLVTAMAIHSSAAKSALARRFAAQAVDMEAAAVAAVAENAGIRFAAVKAISDPFDFDMPPLDRFIDSAGKLNLLQLLVYSAPRPRLWGALGHLGRNAARAAEALAGPLAALQARDPALSR